MAAIVESEAQKLGSKAVRFGMWVGDREILTMAIGHSMTIMPATTDMHYRIGGIAETFMSTLLRPWQVGSDPGDWAFDLAGALPGADRSDLGGQRPQQTGPLFWLRICHCQWLDCAKSQYNGYSGALGYHLATGVTIVVAATKSETAKTDAAAFDLLREVTKYVTPARPINF